MKHKLLFAAAFLLFGTLTVRAQVSEEERLMSMGTQNALTLDFVDVSKKDLMNYWKDYTKDYGKLTKVKKSDDYLLEQVQVLDISGADRLNIYSQVNDLGKEGGKLMVWINDNGAFVSSDGKPEAYSGSVKWLNNFAHYIRVREVEDELAQEQKQLEDLEKELGKLESDREKYLKDIENSKKTIEGRESDTKKNKSDQPNLEADIKRQQKVVEEAESNYAEVRTILPKEQLKPIEKDLKKEQKTLAKMEKDLDKMKKDVDKYGKDIKKAENTIDERMSDLDKNKADQEATKKKIEAQKELVEKVEKKLEKVKGEKL